MKTATIEVYHVHGTKGTTAARVLYRGKILWSDMRNENPQVLANAAQNWARTQGFTHWVVSYT
jgi:hypothetical protein